MKKVIFFLKGFSQVTRNLHLSWKVYTLAILREGNPRPVIFPFRAKISASLIKIKKKLFLRSFSQRIPRVSSICARKIRVSGLLFAKDRMALRRPVSEHFSRPAIVPIPPLIGGEPAVLPACYPQQDSLSVFRSSRRATRREDTGGAPRVIRECSRGSSGRRAGCDYRGVCLRIRSSRSVRACVRALVVTVFDILHTFATARASSHLALTISTHPVCLRRQLLIYVASGFAHT